MAKNKNGRGPTPPEQSGPHALAHGKEENPSAASPSPFSFVGRVMEEMDRLTEDFGLGRDLLAAVNRNLPRGVWITAGGDVRTLW